VALPIPTMGQTCHKDFYFINNSTLKEETFAKLGLIRESLFLRKILIGLIRESLFSRKKTFFPQLAKFRASKFFNPYLKEQKISLLIPNW